MDHTWRAVSISIESAPGNSFGAAGSCSCNECQGKKTWWGTQPGFFCLTMSRENGYIRLSSARADPMQESVSRRVIRFPRSFLRPTTHHVLTPVSGVGCCIR